jgi:hypothetical protein
MSAELLQITSVEAQDFTATVEAFSHLPAASFEAYELFKGTPAIRKLVRADFMEDPAEQSNPNLDLSDVSVPKLHSQTQQLERLLGIIDQDLVVDDADQEAFYEVIAERMADYYFVLQAYQVAGMSPDNPQRSFYADHLQLLNNELYGLPQETEFYGLLSQRRNQAQVALDKSKKPEEKAFIEEYLALLPEAPEQTDVEVYQPSAEAMAHYHALVQEVYTPILDRLSIDDNKEYGPAEIQAFMQTAIEAIDAQGWAAEIEEGGTSLNTSQADRRVYVGSKRAEIKGDELRGLILHEVGVHVYRRVLGEATGNPLLGGKGLSGYYNTEEGLGKFVEQALKEEYKPAGIQYYVLTGLSLGLDGNPRDFRQLFEIEWRQRVVEKLAAGESLNPAIVNKASSAAYIAVTRIRRGMPTDVPGATFTKDLAYYNGSMAIWKFLEEKLLSPEEFMTILTGKHDPTRADHRELVHKSIVKAQKEL